MNLFDFNIEIIREKLFQMFPNPKTELLFNNNFELLVSVVLSAQCTDKRVNLITPKLFNRFPDSKHLSKASVDEVEYLIGSCNLYKNKSKYLIELAKQLEEKFNGEVPLNSESLKSLSGVGQKTANVILIESIGANIMAVDTHVFRVAHRLGLSNKQNVNNVEKDLTLLFQKDLGKLHGSMVLFGRYICKAQKPECGKCLLINECLEINVV